jgi:hypothetical protein
MLEINALNGREEAAAMETSNLDLFPINFAITSYSVARYSSLKDDAPGGVVRGTYLQLFITGANMPGGPPVTEANITFSDRGSDELIGRDVLLGTISDSGNGSASIDAVLPPEEFDICWQILQDAQPAGLFCLIEGGQVVEIDILGGAGATQQEPGARFSSQRRRFVPHPVGQK